MTGSDFLEFVLFLATWMLMWELHRRHNVKFDENQLVDAQVLAMLRAMSAAAESARVSRKESVYAKDEVVTQLETNAAAIKEQVRQVPEAVVTRLKEHDSLH